MTTPTRSMARMPLSAPSPPPSAGQEEGPGLFAVGVSRSLVVRASVVDIGVATGGVSVVVWHCEGSAVIVGAENPLVLPAQ